MNIPPRLFDHEAHSALGHLEARFRHCVERAEADWNAACEAVPRLRKASRGRGRNATFNELVADYARAEFDGETGVEVCEQFGTVRLHYRGEIDIGFKKVDKHGRSSAYPTPRQIRYNNQMPLWGDPLPDAVRLHVGYEWNVAGTEIIDVYMTYPAKRNPLWKYPLERNEAAAVTGTSITTAAPPAKRARFKSTVVKPNEAEKKAE